MKVIFAILWWLITAVTAFLAVLGGVALSSGQAMPLVCFLLSFIFALPPIQPILRSRLPLLKIGVIRFIAWIALVIAGLSLGSSGQAFIANAALCETPQQGICQQDSNNFVKNTQKLYITGNPQNLKDGATVKWELNYRPEPGKTITLGAPPTKLVIKDGKAQLEFAPKNLAVGTYDLQPLIDDKKSIALTKSFKVWDSKQEVEDRKSKKLKDTGTALKLFVMCNPVNDNACKNDISSFKAETKTIGFGVDLVRSQDDARLKLIWKYLSAPDGKEIVISTTTQEIDKKVSQFKYSLNSQSALPPGKYELLVALESQNAEPIRREFTVEKASS